MGIVTSGPCRAIDKLGPFRSVTQAASAQDRPQREAGAALGAVLLGPHKATLVPSPIHAAQHERAGRARVPSAAGSTAGTLETPPPAARPSYTRRTAPRAAKKRTWTPHVRAGRADVHARGRLYRWPAVFPYTSQRLRPSYTVSPTAKFDLGGGPARRNDLVGTRAIPEMNRGGPLARDQDHYCRYRLPSG